MKNFNIKELRRQMVAGGNIANFGGVELPSNGSPFLQRTANYYANANGSGVQNVKGAEAEIYIVVQNTDTVNDLTVALFNKNKSLIDPFNGGLDVNGVAAGVGVGLIVTINSNPHEEFKNRTATQQLLIEGIRIFFPTAAEAARPWTQRYFANNAQQVVNYNPRMHLSAGQQQSNQVDDANFHMTITGDSRLEFLVGKAPSVTTPTEIVIAMNVRAIQYGGELLQGLSPLGVNTGQRLGGNNLY